nr:hypothetical protein [Veillonella denticariosi]
MFFSSIEADYTKMGYPAAIVRALDFLKTTDLKSLSGGPSCYRRRSDVRQCG